MVYEGRGSGGCILCKARRVKCDEAKPHCVKCQRSKRECPGYRTGPQIKFKDETKAVLAKFGGAYTYDVADKAVPGVEDDDDADADLVLGEPGPSGGGWGDEEDVVDADAAGPSGSSSGGGGSAAPVYGPARPPAKQQRRRRPSVAATRYVFVSAPQGSAPRRVVVDMSRAVVETNVLVDPAVAGSAGTQRRGKGKTGGKARARAAGGGGRGAGTWSSSGVVGMAGGAGEGGRTDGSSSNSSGSPGSSSPRSPYWARYAARSQRSDEAEAELYAMMMAAMGPTGLVEDGGGGGTVVVQGGGGGGGWEDDNGNSSPSVFHLYRHSWVGGAPPAFAELSQPWHPPQIPRRLPNDLDHQAICFFLSRFRDVPGPRPGAGYFSFLEPFLRRAEVGACFSTALRTAAMAALSSSPRARAGNHGAGVVNVGGSTASTTTTTTDAASGRGALAVRAQAAYTAALRSMAVALQAPGAAEDDELLAAILLLAFYESLANRRLSGYYHHLQGASTVLKARSASRAAAAAAGKRKGAFGGGGGKGGTGNDATNNDDDESARAGTKLRPGTAAAAAAEEPTSDLAQSASFTMKASKLMSYSEPFTRDPALWLGWMERVRGGVDKARKANAAAAAAKSKPDGGQGGAAQQIVTGQQQQQQQPGSAAAGAAAAAATQQAGRSLSPGQGGSAAGGRAGGGGGQSNLQDLDTIIIASIVQMYAAEERNTTAKAPGGDGDANDSSADAAGGGGRDGGESSSPSSTAQDDVLLTHMMRILDRFAEFEKQMAMASAARSTNYITSPPAGSATSRSPNAAMFLQDNPVYLYPDAATAVQRIGFSVAKVAICHIVGRLCAAVYPNPKARKSSARYRAAQTVAVQSIAHIAGSLPYMCGWDPATIGPDLDKVEPFPGLLMFLPYMVFGCAASEFATRDQKAYLQGFLNFMGEQAGIGQAAALYDFCKRIDAGTVPESLVQQIRSTLGSI